MPFFLRKDGLRVSHRASSIRSLYQLCLDRAERDEDAVYEIVDDDDEEVLYTTTSWKDLLSELANILDLIRRLGPSSGWT